MVEANSLIAALRASSQGAQEAQGSNPGVSFFNPMAGMPATTIGNPAELEPDSAFASSKFFDPENPYAAGAASTNRYGEAYAKEMDSPLMDLSRYGGRYNRELSTPEGRSVFANDTGLAFDNNRGFYGDGDLDPLEGLENLNDPNVKKNYATLFDNGNSFFIPDTVEVNPYQYNYHGPTAQGRTEEQQDADFNRMYHGRMLTNNAAFQNGAMSEGTVNPEALMRQTLNAGANKDPAALAGALRASSGVLAGMDVGRGNISYEQGLAIQRGLESQDNYDNLVQFRDFNERTRGESIANTQRQLANLGANADPQMRAQLEQELRANQEILNSVRGNVEKSRASLDSYLDTVRGITDPTALSTAEVIRLLRL